MNDRSSSKQACNPADKVNQLLDELVATTEASQIKRDRRREPHASLKALSL
ncbi:MAG: hypothetical protein O3A14_08710 [Cyanobacteria bacterium]|nr:hypothetical protein [Cyanobacteriota bacterium]